MRKPLLCFFGLLLFYSYLQAQTCNCDVTLTELSSSSINLIWASQTNYAPGDTICIPAGTYAGLRFYNFEGTATQPVTFMNCGGKVAITETQYSGIAFKGSKHIRLTGTGDATYKYGIHILETTNGGSVGVGIEDLSTDVEIDHIEIQNTGFAGLMAKTDPSCSNPDTWRSNGYVLRNLLVHDNYIHDTGAEGIYIGYTGGYKVTSNRSCNGVPIFGHWLENVDIHDNVIENTAWDGIQLNLVRENGRIRNNYVYNSGTENVYAQDFAMSIGGGVYEVYNNYIENGVGGLGQGMQFISADSGTKVYNNVLVRPDFHAIFLHNRHEFDNPNEGYAIINNTIIEPGDSGIFYNTVITKTDDPAKLYATQETVPTYMINNLVVDPGSDHAAGNTWKGDQESYFDFNKRITRDSTATRIYSNIMTRQMDTLGLQDITNNYYSPLDQQSDLVDAGSDVSGWGITFDLNNEVRPWGSGFDIGAYELQYIVNPPEPDPNDAIILAPNPADISFVLTNEHFKNMAKLTLTTLSGGIVVYDGKYKIGTEFNVEEYSPGLYVITLWTRGKVYTKQLLIQ